MIVIDNNKLWSVFQQYSLYEYISFTNYEMFYYLAKYRWKFCCNLCFFMITNVKILICTICGSQ